MKRSERLERSGEKGEVVRNEHVRRRSLGEPIRSEHVTRRSLGRKTVAQGEVAGFRQIAIFRMFNTTQIKLFGFAYKVGERQRQGRFGSLETNV